METGKDRESQTAIENRNNNGSDLSKQRSYDEGSVYILS